jgi:hypothetical protein
MLWCTWSPNIWETVRVHWHSLCNIFSYNSHWVLVGDIFIFKCLEVYSASASNSHRTGGSNTIQSIGFCIKSVLSQREGWQIKASCTSHFPGMIASWAHPELLWGVKLWVVTGTGPGVWIAYSHLSQALSSSAELRPKLSNCLCNKARKRNWVGNNIGNSAYEMETLKGWATPIYYFRKRAYLHAGLPEFWLVEIQNVAACSSMYMYQKQSDQT